MYTHVNLYLNHANSFTNIVSHAWLHRKTLLLFYDETFSLLLSAVRHSKNSFINCCHHFIYSFLKADAKARVFHKQH